MFKNLLIFVCSCLLAWLNAGVSNEDFVDVVSAPHFNELDLAMTSDRTASLDNSTSLSHVRGLRIIDVNDSSVMIEWDYDIAASLKGLPTQFILEFCEGAVNDDFYEIASIPASPVTSLKANILQHTYRIAGLTPVTNYRVRVVPIFSHDGGRDYPSRPLLFGTIASPINYWEPIFPRRTSKVWYGRGYSDPVIARPHLSEGVEIYEHGIHSDERWWSDAPTLDTPLFPSGRRGQSMTLIDNLVYMFGGRTNGIYFTALLFFLEPLSLFFQVIRVRVL
jgi:hypothetical protein